MKLSTIFSATRTPSVQKKDRVLGIDIGSSSIKVVELQNREGVVTLTTYGELQVGPYAEKEIGTSPPLSPEAEKQALQDLIRESAVKARSGVFAIPLAISFVTVVSLESGTTEDLDSRIRIEARKYIPVPLAEVVLDWAEIETVPAEEKRDILLAAIQNKPLQRFNTLMLGVGYTGAPTEIECFSTIRGANIAQHNTSAVIDFGATTTKLYIARKGFLQRMYRIPVGMEGITTALATSTSVAFTEAELLKKTIAPNEDGYAQVQKVFVNHYDRALKEFNHVLNEYSETAGTPIDAVLLTGSGVVFPGFSAYVSEVINRPVAVVNPFEMVAYPAFMEDTLKQIGPTFTTALGAALRSFI